MRLDLRRGLAMMGVRVHLQWMRLSPYPSAGEPPRADRLGEIVEARGGIWVVCDDAGETHEVDEVRRRVLDHDPTWVVQRPVPTYGVGERYILAWRVRNRGYPEERRPDRIGVVVAEVPPTVTIEDDEAERHVVNRVNGHELAPRSDPRWVIIGRPLQRPAPILKAEYLRAHHDVPRLVTVDAGDRHILLTCPWDEARGGFLPTYDVEEVRREARRHLATVLVDQVQFDERRTRVDLDSLGV